MSEKLDLEAIKARLAAATPGPWRAVEMTHYGEPGTGFGWVAGGKQPCGAIMGEESGGAGMLEDAVFIAHAPEDIAALVAEVERLAEANRELGSYVPQRAELGSTSDFERINFRSAEREAITRPK